MTAGGKMTARILVVDDEEDYRIIIRDVLTEAGYSVSVAPDGEEGLRALRGAPADLVLVDWMMPRMDGEHFSRAVREDRALAATPMIMLTVKRTADEELEALHFGVDDYLVKPFRPEELLARVKAALRRAEKPAA